MFISRRHKLVLCCCLTGTLLLMIRRYRGNMGGKDDTHDGTMAVNADEVEVFNADTGNNAVNNQAEREISELKSTNVSELPALNPPRKIILASSMARSGSSFIGEVLSTMDSTVFFFEPLHKIQDDPCVRSADCVSVYLHGIHNCNFPEGFKEWLQSKLLFLSFLNQNTKKCQTKEKEDRSSCLKGTDVKAECDKSQNRVTKLIRARLEQLEPLLKINKDLKIIHLYRDPRGSITSIYRFGWDKNITRYCSELHSDLLAYKLLNEKYPGQILQLKYEDFSLDPEGFTKILFRFAYDVDVLPSATVEYLSSHTKQNVAENFNPMNSARNSSSVYQKWRTNIRKSLLTQIEDNQLCKESIIFMKHKIFGDVNTARNLSISLFDDNR